MFYNNFSMASERWNIFSIATGEEARKKKEKQQIIRMKIETENFARKI